MKQFSVTTVVIVVLVLIAAVAFASGSHDHGHDDSQQAQSDSHDMHDNHGAMSADGSMAIIGSKVSKGVKGMAHVKDVQSTMAEMGMKTTHHFMMAFVNEETGEQIEKGTVALKVTNPDAKVGETIELVGMDGHFGADIVLDMKGEYHFKLGTKLEDGKKRKYHFHYVIK